MFLLDTNICIYCMKNTFPTLTEKVFSHNPADLFLSSITVYELEYGASKSKWSDKTRKQLAMFLSPFTLLPFDTDDAVAAGSIRAILEQAGTPIGPYDVQIAAQSLSKGLTLITHNTAEFSRVPGLQLDDWTVS